MVFFFHTVLYQTYIVFRGTECVGRCVCADAARTDGSLGPRNIKIVFCLAEHTFAQKQSELFETYSSL